MHHHLASADVLVPEGGSMAMTATVSPWCQLISFSALSRGVRAKVLPATRWPVALSP